MAIGNIASFYDSGGSQVPTQSWVKFQYATQSVNESSLITKDAGHDDFTFNEDGNYLVSTNLVYQDTSNGSCGPEARFTYTGSGNVISIYGSQYNTIFAYNTPGVVSFVYIHGVSSGDTIAIEHRSDKDTMTGGSVSGDSWLMFSRLWENHAVGLYTDNSDTNAYGSQSWVDAPFNTTVLQNDASVIEKLPGSKEILLKKQTCYLIGYGLGFGTGGSRTQRVVRAIISGNAAPASHGYAHQRDGDNEYCDPNALFLYQNIDATGTLSIQCQRGDADVGGSAVRRTSTSGLFILEVPSYTRKFISHDSTGQQIAELALNTPRNLFRDIDYNDNRMFIKSSNTMIVCDCKAKPLMGFSMLVNRQDTSETRYRLRGAIMIDGASQDAGRQQWAYMRGSQTSAGNYDVSILVILIYGELVDGTTIECGVGSWEHTSADYSVGGKNGFWALDQNTFSPRWSHKMNSVCTGKINGVLVENISKVSGLEYG